MMLLLSLVGVAHAGVVEDCYLSAENANPGLNVDVLLGTNSQLTTSDLDAVFDKLAELSTDATLNVSANAAGTAALNEVLECVFDANYVTLSSVWLNENEPTVSARSHTLAVVDPVAGVMSLLIYDEVKTVNGTNYLAFRQTTGCESAFLEVAPSGNDFTASLTATAGGVTMPRCTPNMLCDLESGGQSHPCNPAPSDEHGIECVCATQNLPNSFCVTIWGGVSLGSDIGVIELEF